MKQTFREVCLQCGLLNDEDFPSGTFKDVCSFLVNPQKIFETFVDYVIRTPITNVYEFHEAVKEDLLEQDKILNMQKS